MKLGVLINTHVRHRKFMRKVFESMHALKPAYMVCAYNCNESPTADHTFEQMLPAMDMYDKVDRWTLMVKNKLTGSWCWLVHDGVQLMEAQDLDYIYSTEGDCIVQNPEGLQYFIDRLEKEGGDIVCCEKKGRWDVNDCYVGTTSFLAKKGILPKVTKKMMDDINAGRDISGAEGRFATAILETQTKILDVRNPFTPHFSEGDRGEWGDVLGFTHLHGEEKVRMAKHILPFPIEFYDLRFVADDERQAFTEFKKLGDTAVLYRYGYWR
jgi:hypothetical protein